MHFGLILTAKVTEYPSLQKYSTYSKFYLGSSVHCKGPFKKYVTVKIPIFEKIKSFKASSSSLFSVVEFTDAV